MFPFLSKPELRPTFEDIFFKHYARLLEWALQLTGRNRAEAEDLVQELYIRFARVGPVGEHIQNAEDYLFSVLRNLHYARLRRARTSAIDDLSIVDYDSAERGLRAVDRNAILFVREDLHRICDFLCERKNASRSASIFILRYFLGYFPNEVMKLTLSTRVAIDKAVQAARREARLDLERPGVLKQMGASREPKPNASSDAHDSQDLFLALRGRIFRSCTGECFGAASLEVKYEEAGRSFTTAELAHLVSCPECLDKANRLLGLPLLSERSPDEAIGRDTPQGPGSTGGAAPILFAGRPKRKQEDTERRRKRMERCRLEVSQHRPYRLSIAVDGDIRASQRVTAQLNELQVELRPVEQPGFIEVLSEQNICLAFLLIQRPDPEGSLHQVQEFDLSDDRTLKVTVSFTAECPAIQVFYVDSLIAPDAEIVENFAIFASAIAAPTFELMPAQSSAAWINDLALQLRLWLRRRPFPRMNTLLASAMLFGLCSIVCLLLWTRSGPQISARTLLTRAEQSDASVAKSGRPGVIYQKVKITTSGHSMERAIYRDPERKRRPKRQNLNATDQQIKDRLDQANVAWDEPLSAANFSAWRDRQAVKKDAIARTGDHLLTLTTSTGENSSAIIQESLTVRDSDFHPVARSIELRGEGTVEIAELNYDVMPWGAVNQDWFEPLVGQAVVGVPSIQPSLGVHLPHVLSDLELDEAELVARVALNQLHADTGEQIHLARGPEGIQVKGIVDTDARKQQLVSRLNQLPHVRASILSVEELGTHPMPGASLGGSQPIQAYSVEAQPSPLEQYMREKKLPLDQLGSFSQSLLDGCLKIQQAQVHLFELQQRFKEAKQLPPDQQSQLTELFQTYINAIQAGLDANKRTLLSLGLSSTEQATSAPISSFSAEDVEHQVRQYQELCQQLIANGAEQPLSATAIANELKNSDTLIRSSVAQIRVPPSTAQN
jgi:DNA-directed RNA polymerase specialized sigma24 family protein